MGLPNPNYSWDGGGGKFKVYPCRYADDLIITGRDEQILQQVRNILEKFLAERGLQLKLAKTRIVSIQTGFDFLPHQR